MKNMLFFNKKRKKKSKFFDDEGIKQRFYEENLPGAFYDEQP